MDLIINGEGNIFPSGREKIEGEGGGEYGQSIVYGFMKRK
jgi:hypothetical protein